MHTCIPDGIDEITMLLKPIKPILENTNSIIDSWPNLRKLLVATSKFVHNDWIWISVHRTEM